MSRGTRALAVLALGLACVSLSGCMIIASEGPPDVHRRNTLGEELRDLKLAREDGALDDDEYRSAKQRLIASYDKPPGR